jgi:predicted phage terminase large subunit-like protein
VALKISPQAGPQTKFLNTPAEIAIYGGAAGGGKSYGLLLTAAPYLNTNKFGAVIFRRDYSQVFAEGALWDEAVKIYSGAAGFELKRGKAEIIYHGNRYARSRISFNHIARDSELSMWQGSQICEIGFDELTHFSESVFFYMLSRNRSTCGVRPFVRATCNPDADSWVAKFIAWWINQETGYPIPERSGVIRWFLRRNDEINWADKKSELIKHFGLKTREELAEPKSVTFIASTINDNKILLDKNPGYLANLKALTTVERERLLYGNWKIRPSAGMYFKGSQIGDILQVIPADVEYWVRGWDLAATTGEENDESAYTAGVLIGKRRNGRYLIADVVNVRESANDVRNIILHKSQEDAAKYGRVKIKLPQDPGQAGKAQAGSFIKMLSGFNVAASPESGSKEVRAEPMAAQWQAGNFDILYGAWNDMYIKQLESFPQSKFKDMVDASSTAFLEIEIRAKKLAGTW